MRLKTKHVSIINLIIQQRKPLNKMSLNIYNELLTNIDLNFVFEAFKQIIKYL